MTEFLQKRGSYLTLFFCGRAPVVFKSCIDGAVSEDGGVRWYTANSPDLAARIAVLQRDPQFSEAWTMNWATNRPAQQIF